MGAEKFAVVMEQFGADHGGKPTSVADFEKAVVAAGPDPGAAKALMESWTAKPGLPHYKLGNVSVEKVGKKYDLTLDLQVDGACDRPIDVTVETVHGEVVKRVMALSASTTPVPPVQGEGKEAGVHIEVDNQPLRVVVDKDNGASKANGGAFSVMTFYDEEEETLIVYGTSDEANVNREAAEALQQAIRAVHSNITAPIKSDREVVGDDLKTHHLLLIGRPDCNKITAQFAHALPVTFGAIVRGPRRSVRARRQRRASGGREPDEPAVFRGGDRGQRRRVDVACCAAAGAGRTGAGRGRGAAARQAGPGADGSGEGSRLRFSGGERRQVMQKSVMGD